MRRFAILVAADEYADFTPTDFCHADARLLADTLTGEFDYAPQDVRVHLLSPADPGSPAELIESLREVAARAQAGDSVLFFFAGHGHAADDGAYLILPQTKADAIVATSLSVRDVSAILRAADRLNVRVFDACHSGVDVRTLSTEGGQVPDTSAFTRSILASASSEGWVTLAACKASEYSHPDHNLQQGIFTKALCDALLTFEAAEAVLPELLKVRVCDRVAAWSKANRRVQTPTMNASLSGNMPLAVRNAPSQLAAPSPALPARVDQGSIVVPGADRGALRRIESIRRWPQVGGTAHKDALQQIATRLPKALESTVAPALGELGKPELLPPVISKGGVPFEVAKAIVNHLESKKLRPLHDVRRGAKSLNPWFDQGDDSLQRELVLAAVAASEVLRGPSYEIDFLDWPTSIAAIRTVSDGLVPEVTVWCYVVPLYTTHYCVVVAVIRESGSRGRVLSVAGEGCAVSPSDGALDTIEPLLQRAAGHVVRTVEQDVVQRLAYYEYEATL